jgi:hypothetical protein
LAVMAIIVWLMVKDTVEGFFQYRILAALIGLLAIAALIFAFVFILSIYYMPGWAIALAAAVIASISLWFAAPRAPIFLVVVAFAATVSTMPWIPNWPGALGFILWLLVFALTLARADEPSKFRWFTWAEPFAWIVILVLTARQWGLLK